MTYQLLLSILFFVSAVLLLFIGTVVLRDNPRRRLNRVTGMMLILVGLGPLFAATGDPNSKGLPKWPVYDSKTNTYIELGDEIKAGTNLRKDKVMFWESLKN